MMSTNSPKTGQMLGTIRVNGSPYHMSGTFDYETGQVNINLVNFSIDPNDTLEVIYFKKSPIETIAEKIFEEDE